MWCWPIENESAFISCGVVNVVCFWTNIITPCILSRRLNPYVSVIKIVNTVFLLTEIILSVIFLSINFNDIRYIIIVQLISIGIFICILYYCIKAYFNAE